MKLFKLAVLALALLGLGAMSGAVSLAQKTITVCPSGCQFSKIQEAINAASEGDTIQVKAGVYQESLNINKSITLKGEGQESVILLGGTVFRSPRA